MGEDGADAAAEDWEEGLYPSPEVLRGVALRYAYGGPQREPPRASGRSGVAGFESGSRPTAASAGAGGSSLTSGAAAGTSESPRASGVASAEKRRPGLLRRGFSVSQARAAAETGMTLDAGIVILMPAHGLLQPTAAGADLAVD